MKITIKNWPLQERPRERLLQVGAASLSNAELLAILLRSGSKQHSAVELARLLLQHFESITAILDAPYSAFEHFHGLGPSKYAQLMTVKEIAKRYVSTQLEQNTLNLNQSDLLVNFLRFEFLAEQQEVFAVLCLDASLNKIDFKKLFYGSINYCDISINQLLRYAIGQHANSIVIVHNHPFTKAEPSTADLNLTQKIHQACTSVEIQLLDHFIIAQNNYFSFAEHGLIQTL